MAVFATTLVAQARKDEVLARFRANGRDMALSHEGMGTTEADWTRFIEIVMSVAGELGVGPTGGGEVLAFLDSLKADIVAA